MTACSTASASSSAKNIVDAILAEFVLHLKHTFADGMVYVGTTSDLKVSIKTIRDIDVMLVLSRKGVG